MSSPRSDLSLTPDATTAPPDPVRNLREQLEALEAGDPIAIDGWLLLPIELGADGPAVIAVRDR